MFSTSIYQARFLIKSGCIKVNGNMTNSPHKSITPGSIIENVDKNAYQTYYLRKLHELDNIFPAPAYLHNLDHAKGVLVRAPLTHEIHLPFTHPSIVSKYNLFVNRPA
jgi:ribosomal protein S4